MTTAGEAPGVVEEFARPVHPLATFWHDFAHNKGAVAGLAFVVIAVVVALFADVLAPYGPAEQFRDAFLAPPAWVDGGSLRFVLGTDDVGRDIFARFNKGAQMSLAVGAIVVAVGAAIGGAIGLVAGVFRGWLDTVLMRAMDAILAFPPLILAMAVTVGLGVGVKTASLGIIITTIPYYARLLRSDVLRLRSLLFVEAAAAIGASPARIIMRHIAPHTVSTLSIQAAAVFGYAILSLAALGFVGLGVQIPTPEWGTMITGGLNYALTGQWWIAVFPGIGLLAAVTATSIVADRARDILDPRGRYAHV